MRHRLLDLAVRALIVVVAAVIILRGEIPREGDPATPQEPR